MRVTKVGWALIAFAVCTAVVTAFAPFAGLVMAGVLAVVLLLALAEGMGGGSDSHQGHEAWAKTDTDRRREARQGRT
jgi:hypothetical protein